jgi:hypothetical protein
MIRVVLIINLFFISFASCQQKKKKFFTGTIKYQYTYSSNTLNEDSLTDSRPASAVFRYDLSDYQSMFTGKDTIIYYYAGKKNKVVSATGNPVSFACEDYGQFTDSVLSVKSYDTTEKVLGYACRVLEIQKKNSWVQYFIAKDLQIAPDTYQRHVAYNWDVYGKEAKGGLILKLEHRFLRFSMKGEVRLLEKSNNPTFRALEIDTVFFNKICQE